MGVPNSLRSLHQSDSKSGAIKRGNLFSAKIELIQEEEGFNARDYDRKEVVDYIRQIADAYKAGEQLPPLTVVVRNGTIFVREGHCRLRGAKLAREEGAPIEYLQLNEMQGDEIDQSVLVLTSNDQLKLTSLERARQYARLKAYNLSDAEIAKRVHRTVPHVIQHLAMNNLPVRLKNLINEGVISPSLALEAYQEQGDKAVDLIEGYGAKAPESPRREADTAALTAGTVDAGNLDQGENDAVATAEPERPEPTAIQVKPKRVTRQTLDVENGFRSKITGKLAKKVTEGINSIAARIPPIEDHATEVVLRMSADEARSLIALQKSILPKQSKQDSCAATDS